MIIFFDTSAFLKRYIDESGSDDVESLCLNADEVVVSIVLPIEAVSAFSRLKREKKVSLDQYRRMKESFFNDLRDVTILPIHPSTVGQAVIALEKMPLKALDAIHVGCAIEYKPDYFVSADKQQLAAAQHHGLKIKALL